MAGKLFLIGSNVLLTGVPILNELHEHYSASLILSNGKPFRFRTGSSDWIESRSIFVRPNVEQQLDAQNEDIFIFHFDPDNIRIHGSFFSFPSDYLELDSHLYKRILKFLKAPVNEQEAITLWKELLNELKKDRNGSEERDPRIETVVQKLAESVPDMIPLEELTKFTGLSESRLMHLFKDEVGIPMRKYIQWLRIKACVFSLSRGNSLTLASHEAGFADQAHMSRTFREMFGLKPSLFLKNSSSVQVIFCDFEDDIQL
ncbi:helix-turn-helix transcriptional regulator [Leptospira stimsonii]|uniref:AraC family transcriptional regulator n=1 Tax=Leptospira stimsonii TaxID=2202203 RepID=A0A4V6QMI9_9LEPT|nr:AraC family transcriptional regulator [Leptospira stimsonii]RHX88242.1 AraC family transcriptional regulator [Leptospira stimsonii]TGK26390.1 AraC family transcriptional regulator [Leptospira stimsonii]TGM10711.1 AraC family transcriptional regulator [Leptospira stimsonii]